MEKLMLHNIIDNVCKFDRLQFQGISSMEAVFT